MTAVLLLDHARPSPALDDCRVLATDLRAGIERGELVVHYQPKRSLRDGSVRGVEALVRWNHPRLGLLAPDWFIPLAERTGVIRSVTTHVLERVTAQSRVWQEGGRPMTVSVNVSPADLMDAGLPSRVEQLLCRHALPARALQLELTGTRSPADLSGARRVVDALRAMGTTIAIDDFGTGFSPLAQLQKLRVDEIKIHRCFVTGMTPGSNDEAIVRSTIDLARNLGLAVTAEGVETEAVRRQLVALGCEVAQGFHLGRPVPADALG